jgi:predicted transcriptional regulator
MSSSLNKVKVIILEALSEGGGGCPSSYIYLPLNQIGLSLDSYHKLIGIMVRDGLITSENHYIEITDQGEQYIRNDEPSEPPLDTPSLDDHPMNVFHRGEMDD